METRYDYRAKFREELNLSVWDDGFSAGVYWAMARSEVCGIDGYVMVPEGGHPWSDRFPKPDVRRFDESPLQQLTVHGGIMVAKHPWLGFYTRHPGDEWDYRFDPMGVSRRSLSRDLEQRQWTPSRVEYEVMRLAEQVASIGLSHRQRLDSVRWASRIGLSRFEHLDVAERNTL